ncbi:MAG: phenylalanine--tRNA ligase subunit beta [Patescibacteria group bacterium]
MKILKSWLKDYVKIDLSDEKLSDKFNRTGTEVESVACVFDEKVVVAKIHEVKPHPGADRLKIARIFNGKETIDIVCGASNIMPGQKVPLAQIGANLGAVTIQKATIRGVESCGMLCAEDELGLGPDHTGIKILDENCVVGKPLNRYVCADSIFDLDVTPNRGDQLSHLGMAREAAAFCGKRVVEPEGKIAPKMGGSPVAVLVERKSDCPRYYTLAISGVAVAPSPRWLQDRLIKAGLRPINNIVDITNYVMLDVGQPLHAFDRGMISKETLVVRSASQDEALTALDGRRLKLEPDMLVVADLNKPLALAGVLGGEESGVTARTTNIILEAAEFNPKSIRRTAKALGLRSEASYRFERGIDPAGVIPALLKAAEMILDIAGGKIEGGIGGEGEDVDHKTLGLFPDKINSLLGLSLSVTEMIKILKHLGFEIEENSVIVPTWRHDIHIWQDLAEEIGRIHGYDQVPLAPLAPASASLDSPYRRKELVKDLLFQLGLSEVANFSFLSEQDTRVAQIKTGDLVEVANPIQSENRYLRNSLVPGLLGCVAKNAVFDPVAIFEIGHVFWGDKEQENLGVAVSGKEAEKIVSLAREKLLEISALTKKDIPIGTMSRGELARFKIRKPAVYLFELPLSGLVQSLRVKTKELTLSSPASPINYRPVSRYPAVTRDVAFVVGKEVEPAAIIDCAYDMSDIINRVELFDEYTSPSLGAGKKSFAFHLYLQHMDRTLTQAEADDVVAGVIEKIQSHFGAKLRE